jgi:hypothetical protein
MADDDLLLKTPSGAIDEPAMTRDADARADAKLARGVLGGRDPITVPTVKSDVDYQALMPGKRFKDEKGTLFTKPYTVKNDQDYDAIPEGAQFVDTQGKRYTKPVYQGVDFTTQTLYDMSTNDKERRKALERAYPGKVQERNGQLTINDNGTLRRPKGFTDAPVAGIAGAAFPVIGSIGGEMLGGAAGSVVPGAGTLGGAVLGSAAGGAVGQGFNDIILGLTGVYDRSGGEEALNIGESAAAGGVGTAAGRALAAVAPAVKGKLQEAGPKALVKFLGADAEAFEQASKLRNSGMGNLTLQERILWPKALKPSGVLVPASTWAKESPHLANINEVFDPAFRMQKPLLQSATAHYEKSAGDILEQIGVKPVDKISDPTAAPSVQKAGEAILAKRLEAQNIADQKLADAVADAQAKAASGSVGQAAERVAVDKTAAESRAAAQDLIDIGFKDIQNDVDQAMRVAQAGHNSGDLWQAIGDKFIKIRQGIAARAKIWYGQADVAAGDHLPNIGDLPKVAADFLEQLPEPFRAKYPDAVKKLSDFGGIPKPDSAPIKNRIAQIQIELQQARIKPNSNTAALQQELVALRQQLLNMTSTPWIKEPLKPTFGQLHELRSWFRYNIDKNDLTPSVRDGIYKFFAEKVDGVLHDPNAVPELQIAAQLLDSTDTWYGEQIRPLQDARIKAVMDGLRSGLPADSQNLFDTLIKEGRTDLTKKVAELIGPNLMGGVRAADVQQMFNASKTLVPDVIDGNVFAREVLSRYRTGMLEAVHGSEASAKLLKQAQHIAMLDGKLDIPVRPGDKIADVIAKARVAADVAKQAAKKDPLTTLDREMKKIKADHQRQLAQGRRADPLGFIYDRTVGAAEAVNRILGSEDLILAAGARFGEQSPEFNMLRQVWAQRIFMNTLQPGERVAKTSPEVQNLMFPGILLGQMQTLVKEMDFLLSGKSAYGTAQSMSAMAKVEHPWSSILGKGGEYMPKIPIADPLYRMALSKYYAFVTKMVNSPTLFRIVERGLKGDPQAKQMTRQAMQTWMQRSGAIGAGLGESAYQQ